MSKTKPTKEIGQPAVRSWKEVGEELAAVRDEYRSRANELTPPQVAEYNNRIKALMKEQDELIRGDAPPCPRCGAVPHGRVKFPGIPERERADGRIIPAQGPTFEIMCVGCETQVAHETEIRQKRAAAEHAPVAQRALDSGEEVPPAPSPDLSDIVRPPVGSGGSPEAAVASWKKRAGVASS